jgi:5-methylcytosine-specific restriction protein A
VKATGPTLAARAAVQVRDGDYCQRCGRQGQQIHHRKPRGMGGTSDPMINNPANLVLLCQDCHMWIERNREVGYAQGWLVHRTDDPAMVPMTMLTGTQLIHDQFGNKIVQPPLLEGA